MPDCFLRFEVGSPIEGVAIVLEAKLGAKQTQYAGQWNKEMQAFEELGFQSDRDYFCPIGGLGDNPVHQAKEIAKSVQGKRRRTSIHPSTWSRLATVLRDTLEDNLEPHQERVVSACIAILGRAGHRAIRSFDEMQFSLPDNWDPEAPLSCFCERE